MNSAAKPFSVTLWLIVIVAAIGFLFDTYELLMTPLVAPAAIAELLRVPQNNPLVTAWVGKLLWITALCGGVFGLLGGWLTDKLGRKTVMAAAIFIYSFSPVAAAFSKSLEMFVFFRCTTFIGVCVEFVAAITWLAEVFEDKKQRERWLGITQAFASLGGVCVSACDSLEIAHGPQSTLYGGEAVGGVVSLRAMRGAGAAGASVSAEAGSFGTVQGGIAAQGERGANAWNFAARGGHTDNARDNNSFDSATTTLRLDRKINDRVAIGGTVRWFHGAYGDPGDRFTNDPDNQIREENLLTTAFVDLKLADAWQRLQQADADVPRLWICAESRVLPAIVTSVGANHSKTLMQCTCEWPTSQCTQCRLDDTV